MAGFASGGIGDLVAAARAVGGEQRVRRCRAHPRQYAELADLYRYFVMFGFIAERPGHAAARRVEGFDLEARDQPQRLYRGADGAECLLVAMPVKQCRLAFHGGEWQLEAARLALTLDELFEKLSA